jgi:plastocyanin
MTTRATSEDAERAAASRPRWGRTAAAAILGLAGLAGLVPARAARTATLGSIRGRVDVRREVSTVEPRPVVTELGAPARPDTPDRRRSVVYLEAAPQGAFEEHERPRAVLDQRRETFVPYVLAIEVGTTVEFQNNDSTYHNVFSFSKPKRFDLGRYARGESKSVRFDRPGVVRVFCDIHSHMSAFILVFAHRFFAVTDGDGRFRIDAVPPGEYNVVAWNDGQARDTRTVRVPPDGGGVEADFTVK